MYIEQAFKVLHDWWRYIVGVIISIVGVSIFSLPHGMAVMTKRMKAEVDVSRLNDASYLMSLFESNLNLVFVLLPFLGGLVFLIIAARFLHQQSITSLTTARPKIDWGRIWFAFILWGAISTSLIAIDYTMSPENYVYNFEFKRFAILAVLAIVLIPFQTSFEEYLFRGYLMQGIGVVTKTRWVPLITTSVIFGLLHIANPEVDQLGYGIMVFYIGTGLFLGIITLMDDGMELALGFHAANNLFTALLVTANWTAFQTHSVFKDVSEPEMSFIDVILPVFIVFPILLFVFAKKYKWSNWGNKLFGNVKNPNAITLYDNDENTKL